MLHHCLPVVVVAVPLLLFVAAALIIRPAAAVWLEFFFALPPFPSIPAGH